MSSIAVQGGATGTGTVTVVAPSTSINRTLTLPDQTGTLVSADASGNVGIGTSSPSTWSGAKLVASTSTSTASQIAIDNNSYATGQTMGIDFTVAGGSKQAFARAIVENGSTAATALTFGTATGGNNAAERARIDSSGNLLVGATSTTFNNTAKFVYNAGSEAYFISPSSCMTLNRTGTDGNIVVFTKASSIVGNISVTASTTAYNTSSDYRLKEAIAPMTGALAKVAALKPCTYKWKVDGSNGQGFIAHELAEVEAGCVTGEKDAVNAEGNPQYQGIDTSFLVATLTAAIQELKALVDTQAARITALEQA